ncbi:hypothetical protein [Nannocystis exedens]|uniref:hypothetical protein n=1 Tax=Nannocystis exedens TaxID=54 RepID=UPI001FE43876|nr:hypothetical protein [Nannocystis exedens]
MSLTLIPFVCGCGDAWSGSDDPPSDELSMPRAPTVALDSFASAEDCGLCHQAHYAEWAMSAHAYAMKDPVFRAFVAVRQENYAGKQDKFCRHQPRRSNRAPGLVWRRSHAPKSAQMSQGRRDGGATSTRTSATGCRPRSEKAEAHQRPCTTHGA